MGKIRRQSLMFISANTVMVLFVCAAVWMYGAREENAQEMDAVLQRLAREEKRDSYAAEIDALNHLVARGFLKDKDRIRAYAALSTIYAWRQDYPNTLKYSVEAIYYAEQANDQPAAAWSYLQLSDAFIQLGAYDLAEDLIGKVLGYEARDVKEARRIKELGYINLADICAATGRNEETRHYLKLADQYEAAEDYNHANMLQIKRIFLAETYWNEQRYEEMRSILATVEDINDGTDMALLYVHIPLMELRSKLAFASGETESARQQCDDILAFYTQNGYEMKKIEYLTKIVQLLREKQPSLCESYDKLLMELYPEAIQNVNRLAAEFLLSSHTERVTHYNERGDRNFLIFVVAVCWLVLLALLCMLRRSWKQGRTDALTGVYNRRYLNQVYAKYKAGRARFGIIMIDIDHFKQVNDTWGHEVGDRVLKELSRLGMMRMPRNARLFRFGGEEFCILFKTDCKDEVVELAQELRRHAEGLSWEGNMKITISLGVAYSGQAEDLLGLADQNLYCSKMSGRNSVTYL